MKQLLISLGIQLFGLDPLILLLSFDYDLIVQSGLKVPKNKYFISNLI